MRKNITDDLDEILARAMAAVDARAPASPVGGGHAPEDARARRLRALSAAGWEAKALRIASSGDYDEGRAAGYLASMRALGTCDAERFGPSGEAFVKTVARKRRACSLSSCFARASQA